MSSIENTLLTTVSSNSFLLDTSEQKQNILIPIIKLGKGSIICLILVSVAY